MAGLVFERRMDSPDASDKSGWVRSKPHVLKTQGEMVLFRGSSLRPFSHFENQKTHGTERPPRSPRVWRCLFKGCEQRFTPARRVTVIGRGWMGAQPARRRRGPVPPPAPGVGHVRRALQGHFCEAPTVMNGGMFRGELCASKGRASAEPVWRSLQTDGASLRNYHPSAASQSPTRRQLNRLDFVPLLRLVHFRPAIIHSVLKNAMRSRFSSSFRLSPKG
jgi:hypothetical protein